MAERSEERFWCAELHLLRGVFLAAMGADETQIEASFYEASIIAKEQTCISSSMRRRSVVMGSSFALVELCCKQLSHALAAALL